MLSVRACLHWGGEPPGRWGNPLSQGYPPVNIISHIWSTHLSCKRRDQWEIIRACGLPHLNGLPHLPGVPHLHVNRPQNADSTLRVYFLYFIFLKAKHHNLTDRRTITSPLTCQIRSKTRVYYHQMTCYNSLWFWLHGYRPHRLGTSRSNDATATRTSLKKWICVLSVFIAIIPIHLLCQLLANPPGVEFQRTIFKLRKRNKFRRWLFTFSIKREIRHFDVVVVQKREGKRKAWCTCEVVVLLIKPFFFDVLVVVRVVGS